MKNRQNAGNEASDALNVEDLRLPPKFNKTSVQVQSHV